MNDISEKWTNLIGGKTIEATPIEAGAQRSWNAQTWFILALVAIAAYWIIWPTKTTLSSYTGPQPVGLEVVNTNAEPDIGKPDVPIDAPVDTKFKATDRFFSSDESIEEPFLDNFSSYQQAFQMGREKYVLDKPTVSKRYVDQLDPMRQALAKNGQSLDDFIDAQDIAVPEALVDAWASEPLKTASVDDSHLTHEGTFLAREALQTVPMSGAPDIEGLRDILAARTEAAKIGLTLPQIPEEQKVALQYWSNSGNIRAAAIANSILTRA